jgi:vacuolar-type H+-ATPase subunit H
MVEDTMRSILKAEHQLENMVESSTDGSPDSTEKEFHELRRITEQAALSAVKATENWGKQALAKTKEYVEEINL